MDKKTKSRIILRFLCFIIIGGFFLFPALSNAQYTYTPLEPIPGFSGATDFPAFIVALYKFGIWTVGIAALLMITIGGFMYLTSAGNTSKMDSAKGVITDALIGLIIALAAYLILYVINPDLVKVQISFSPISSKSGTSSIQANSTSSADQVLVGGGSCSGLSTQSGIDKQCGDASPELTKMLECIKSKQPGAVISSISDSQGYTNCVNNYRRPPCAHAQNSCHYGGKSCAGKGSYAVDLTTRNLSSSELKAAASVCGANYIKDEGNHVHASVGKQAGCSCN